MELKAEGQTRDRQNRQLQPDAQPHYESCESGPGPTSNISDAIRIYTKCLSRDWKIWIHSMRNIASRAMKIKQTQKTLLFLILQTTCGRFEIKISWNLLIFLSCLSPWTFHARDSSGLLIKLTNSYKWRIIILTSKYLFQFNASRGNATAN